MPRPRSPWSRGRWTLALAVVLAACGGPPGADVSPDAAPEYGGTAVVGISADFDDFNEFTNEGAWGDTFIAHVLFQTLVKYDADLRIVGALADSFGVADDGLSATFRLHEGITWHDGEPFDAEDVAWSFDVSKDPATAYPNVSELQYVESAEVLDPRRVRFRFSRRHAEPIADFARWAPMPKHLLEAVPHAEMVRAPFNRDPVGNGPFRFVSWDPNAQAVFEAYEPFYAGRPYLDRIVFRIVPERTTLVTELLTGGMDLAPNIPPADMARLDESPATRALSYPSTSSDLLMYNVRDSRFDDPRVRRALTMAMDREAIVEALLYGYGQVANGPVSPAQWPHADDLPPLPHDPERARALLAEAGWRDTDGDGWLDKDGRPFRFEVVTNVDSNLRSALTVVLQDQFRKVGIDARPRTTEFNQLVDDLVSGAFETIVVGFVWPTRFDPSQLLLTDAAFNGGGYSDPHADSLALAALATMDRAEAKALWAEYQRVQQEDQPITWVYTLDATWGVSRRLRGARTYSPDVYGVLESVREWWIPAAER